MTDDPAARRSADLRLASQLLAGFGALAVALAAIIFVRARYDARYPVEFVEVVLWQLGIWLPWVGLGLLVARLARLLPYALYPPPIWLALHLLGALGIASAHALWFFFFSDAFSPYRGMVDTRFGAFAYFFIFWFVLDIVLYGLLLGLVHGYDYYSRYRTQTRQVVELERALAGSADQTAERAGAAEPPDYLVVRKSSRRHLIPIDRLDWIEAQGYYAALHTGSESYLIRESLSKLAERLDGGRFIRVHRSTIVNVDFIKSLEARGDKAWTVTLADGTSRRVSRAGRQRLAERLRAHAEPVSR